jgi:hypothetical protein
VRDQVQNIEEHVERDGLFTGRPTVEALGPHVEQLCEA